MIFVTSNKNKGFRFLPWKSTVLIILTTSVILTAFAVNKLIVGFNLFDFHSYAKILQRK